MDKRTVESLCSVRNTADIVNILTRELDENEVGQADIANVQGLLRAAVECLVWERDQGKRKLSFNCIKEATTLEGLAKLSRKGGASAEMRSNVVTYLKELPGFNYDAVDEDGAINADFKGGRFNLEGARKSHDYFRSLFMTPATKAGL